MLVPGNLHCLWLLAVLEASSDLSLGPVLVMQQTLPCALWCLCVATANQSGQPPGSLSDDPQGPPGRQRLWPKVVTLWSLQMLGCYCVLADVTGGLFGHQRASLSTLMFPSLLYFPVSERSWMVVAMEMCWVS